MGLKFNNVDMTDELLKKNDVGKVSYGYNSNIANFGSQGNQVAGHMSMIKHNNNKCDIHIQGRIIKMVHRPSASYSNQFLLDGLICTTLGINDITIENQRQTFAHVYKESGEKILTGITGLMFGSSDQGTTSGFYYFDNNTLMPLPLTHQVYDEGNFFNIDIYGATYS